MDEKGTMTATFEPTLDVWKLIDGKQTEYVVVNPVTVEARLRSGEVRRYPQEIRERIVRCRDCVHSCKDGTLCTHFSLQDDDDLSLFPSFVEPDGFCAWGSPRAVTD